jgi:hypothetical protein
MRRRRKSFQVPHGAWEAVHEAHLLVRTMRKHRAFASVPPWTEWRGIEIKKARGPRPEGCTGAITVRLFYGSGFRITAGAIGTWSPNGTLWKVVGLRVRWWADPITRRSHEVAFVEEEIEALAHAGRAQAEAARVWTNGGKPPEVQQWEDRWAEETAARAAELLSQKGGAL